MIKKLWGKIKDWYREYQFRKIEAELWEEARQNIEMNTAIDIASIIQEDREQKYFNGLAIMKRKIREQTEGKSVEEQEQVMKTIGESMLEYAHQASEGKEQLAKALKSAYVYQGQDIKSEEDHKKMLDKRIKEMYNLQNKKLERQLLRDARKAYNEGDLKRHEALMKEWKVKYGRTTRYN